MPKAGRFNMRVEGLSELRRAIRAENLYAEPLRDGLQEAADAVAKEARRVVYFHSRSGRLFDSIKTFVSKAKIPRMAKVTANASRRKFRYGYALNASSRYHWKDSRASTVDWFGGIRKRMSGTVAEIISRVDAKIASRWPS